MNENAFYTLQLIQSQQLPFSKWDIFEDCSSTSMMFGTIFDFELVGKWLVLYFDTNKEVLDFTNNMILLQPTMVLRTRYGKETCIYFYPCDEKATHCLSKKDSNKFNS